jgi:hypothetical protein
MQNSIHNKPENQKSARRFLHPSNEDLKARSDVFWIFGFFAKASAKNIIQTWMSLFGL